MQLKVRGTTRFNYSLGLSGSNREDNGVFVVATVKRDLDVLAGAVCGVTCFCFCFCLWTMTCSLAGLMGLSSRSKVARRSFIAGELLAGTYMHMYININIHRL